MRSLNTLRFFLFSLLVLTHLNVYAETTIYTDLFNNKAEAVLQFTNSEIQLGDLVHDAKYCNANENYYCISSRVFVFSVPKVMFAKFWHRDGASYKIIAQRDEWILGKRIKYWVIRQKIDKQILDYIYSREKGIISIRTDKNQLILSSGCGLFSTDSTNDCFNRK